MCVCVCVQLTGIMTLKQSNWSYDVRSNDVRLSENEFSGTPCKRCKRHVVYNRIVLGSSAGVETSVP